MTVAPRPGHPRHAPPERSPVSTPRPGHRTRTFEARWRISRRAVTAARPDLAFAPEGDDLVLSWFALIGDRSASEGPVAARAVIWDDDPASGKELLGAAVTDGRWCSDPDVGYAAIEVRHGGRLVLLLTVRFEFDAERRRAEVAPPSGMPACDPAYASTPLMNLPAPLGLAVGGGRYEFEGAFAWD